jgi:hypothetical protein
MTLEQEHQKALVRFYANLMVYGASGALADNGYPPAKQLLVRDPI